jgi:hypothetical protein
MHELSQATLMVCLWIILVSRTRFHIFGLDSISVPEV